MSAHPVISRPTAANFPKARVNALFSLLVISLLALAGCSPAPATATLAPGTRPSVEVPTVAPGTTELAPTPTDSGFKDLIPLAQNFVDQLVIGDYTAAGSRFDATMKAAMPDAKLKDAWQQLLAQTGAFQKQLGTQTLESKGYKIVLVTCQFANSVIDVQVVFDAQTRIAGLFFKPGQAPQPTAPVSDANIKTAQAVVDLMAKGDFAGAILTFDDTMKRVLNETMLKQSWDQTQGSMGAFKASSFNRTGSVQGLAAVYITCQFEKGPLDLQLIFNDKGQVSGMHFVATASGDATTEPYTAPAYVKSDAFTESDVTVGSGEWALPGTLTLPVGPGPFPAVVLVHGSGPNDRNETIGPNQPFKDLAWGLASQGIAVLRYDKRTLAHKNLFTPDVIANLTLQGETIDDALLAAQLLRQTAKIDPKQVFVLGHSLGGTAAPRIGQQDPALAGLIVMAGMTIPFEDEVLRQVIYLDSLNGGPSESQKAQEETLKTQVARVKDPNLSAQTPKSDLPLGVSPAYWLDLRGYQPAEVAKSLAMPIFVLQGERDYQVTPDQDFKSWQTALAGKANATLKLYPGLNHLFILGQGQPNPTEYNTAGHVSADVVNDIAQWVKQN